ncbi:unnamed protein product [Caenorhabditis auriculariae]|uniref:Uncharacterized protein n=1 Tax=Caenorhabditis auriculariae TaxID=2777116 RepID=A0A8S1HVT7_9PELO|nr:unnamed protein product [Caenorhabditis auriculariae]
MAEIGGEWKSRSIFLEVKPRSDLASLFVDCPPSVLSAALSSKENCDGADSEKKVNGTTKTFSRPQTPAEVTACVKNGNGIEGLEVVRVLEHCVQLGAPPLLKDLVESKRSQRRGSDSSVGSAGSGGSGRKKKSRSPQNGPRFGASIRGLSMAPRTLCAPTWADNHRLFMCKVHAESKGAPLVPKTFHKLARDMCDFDKLEAFANRGQPQLSCSRCSASLLLEENKMTIGCLPDDEWLATSQSADFYCRDSCGAACDPDRHKHGKHGVGRQGKSRK